MANPNPQHNPTDGLNVAAFVQVTGTNITNCNGGGLTVANEATYPGTEVAPGNGQGYGAVAGVRATPPGTSYPVAQYALQLSLGAKTYLGTAYAATCQLAVQLKDVANTTYSTTTTPTYKSYGNPGTVGPNGRAYSNYSDTTSTSPAYSANIASVSGSGLITGLAIGQCIVEVQFPTFDFNGGITSTNPEGEPTQASGDPVMMIYAQILVQVVA